MGCDALKTGIVLALIADHDLLDRVATSKRGGYTFVGTELCVKANKKYLEYYGEHVEPCFHYIYIYIC